MPVLLPCALATKPATIHARTSKPSRSVARPTISHGSPSQHRSHRQHAAPSQPDASDAKSTVMSEFVVLPLLWSSANSPEAQSAIYAANAAHPRQTSMSISVNSRRRLPGRHRPPARTIHLPNYRRQKALASVRGIGCTECVQQPNHCCNPNDRLISYRLTRI